ncbi:MAG: hypothetical protein CMD39_06480 [Gammaproteobacteria bacterium]|nr:hypothetical protein [Gammaproteobacteria bacterium]
MELTHRYYADEDQSSQAVHAALIAVLATLGGIALFIDRDGGASAWIGAAVPGIVALSGAYVYLRARLLEGRPVVEVSASELRWRPPRTLLFRRVALAEVIATSRGTDGELHLMTRSGIYHVLPLGDMNLRGASFTADVIASEVERAVAVLQPRRRGGSARRGPATAAQPDSPDAAADQPL